ncbi:MAG: hypothetical protein M3Y27_11800 [Acidobacteriota bacterium]|nr:hypothetical protein [Acidobacteriota bacterium]
MAAAPVKTTPPAIPLTPEVVLVCTPALRAVTITGKLQDAIGASVTPETIIVLPTAVIDLPQGVRQAKRRSQSITQVHQPGFAPAELLRGVYVDVMARFVYAQLQVSRDRHSVKSQWCQRILETNGGDCLGVPMDRVWAREIIHAVMT